MTPDTYKIIEMAVNDGVRIGVNRAYKHNDNPDKDAICDSVNRHVMTEICTWFKFKGIESED